MKNQKKCDLIQKAGKQYLKDIQSKKIRGSLAKKAHAETIARKYNLIESFFVRLMVSDETIKF